MLIKLEWKAPAQLEILTCERDVLPCAEFSFVMISLGVIDWIRNIIAYSGLPEKDGQEGGSLTLTGSNWDLWSQPDINSASHAASQGSVTHSEESAIYHLLGTWGI